jgi:hypothetical protein
MSPPPRPLTFTVSTTLLSASLALGAAGCDDGKTVNVKEPAKDPSKDPGVHQTVNEGPEPEPKRVNEGPEPEPEPVHVNEGPEPEPTAVVDPQREPGMKVNPGPEVAPVLEPEPPEVRVNVRAPTGPEPRK